MLNKPARTKYPTYHNLKKPISFKLTSNLLKTKYALIATENGILTAAQIAAANLAIKRKIKQNINLLVRVFPHLPVTKRPPEMPLGKGKSNIAYWATPIKAGSVIFELNSNQEILIKAALIAASYKLPIKTQIVNKLF